MPSKRFKNGRIVKILVVLDEFMRECPATDVNRGITGEDVVEVLRYLSESKTHFIAIGSPLGF